MTEQIFTNCTVGGATFVHVKDGKITKIRPIVFDDTDAPSWTIEARGKKFKPPRQTSLGAYIVPEKSRIYSEQRLKYPLKRVDFDPNGERNPQNRGKSGYERISWDEAFDIVTSEIKRIHKTYGKAAITASTSSHANFGLLQYKMGGFGRFWNMLGYTFLSDNPDSWEGWLWGAAHAWGYYWKLGVSDNFDMLEEALKHTKQVIFWGVDPNTSAGGYNGQDSMRWRLWCKELGIKFIAIDPWCNYTAATWGDKWIAPRPATDAALAEAIAYVWIKEGTYDKEFVEGKTVGFDEFQAQILGETDGTPRTPEWASKICDVPARDIYALAREWAARPSMLATGSMYGVSSAARQPYATEWARMMVLLLAMQGLGKKGVNTWGGASMGPPADLSFRMFGYSDAGWDTFGLVAKEAAKNSVNQTVYRLLLPETVMDPPQKWIGEGFCGQNLEQQFTQNVCPEPGPDGAPIKMIYRHGASYISTMTDTSRWVRMYQHPNLEFCVIQDCHWQSETRFADIILPACTNFEREDICELGAPGGYGALNLGASHRVIIYQHKCIEPLWESRSDYDIYCELADRLGFKDKFTEGNTMEDWIYKIYEKSSLPRYVTFEEFKKKGYFVVPSPTGDYKRTVSNRWYYEGRECDVPDYGNPLLGTEKSKEMGTYSGKIEFVSQSLKQHFPNDEERPPLPRFIEPWEGANCDLAEKYPLVMVCPHMRFSYHTHHDNKSPWLDEIKSHRIKVNGYAYWPIRLHGEDAAKRGIRNGDLVKLHNDRGAILGVAVTTERVRKGIVFVYQAGAKYDPIEPGNPKSIDRGGCANLLTPKKMVSKNAPGMACNSTCVEIEKWEA
ncbi:MAG: molybdopterin-dependent oxidoreductase [Desulfobacteraceae bacterium]|jgi:trimethylamine-N-oxide reductase (cytochrome c)